MPDAKSILIENRHFCLKLSENCVAQSLVLKSGGEECLEPDSMVSFFTLTQNRPYNNEIKLTYPNKRTEFRANRVRREGDELIVGFELVTFEAVVTIEEADKIGASYKVGNLLSSDIFYNADPDASKKWQRMGILGVEMEAAALYMNAAYAGKRALAICTVSDHLFTGEALDAESRQNSFTEMMEIALNTAIRFEK